MTHRLQERGQVLVLGIVFSAIFITMLTGLVGYSTSSARLERQTIARVEALALAEAGIDKAIYEMNQSGSYSGENGIILGNGTIDISVASAGNGLKRITSTAYVPDSTNPTATREVQANAAVNSSVVSFRFGVQVGNGGVSMDNGSTINGNIFSNGNISGGGLVTGDATVAGGTAPSTDQSYTTQNLDFNLGDIAARANAAQPFTPTVSETLNKISLNLRKIGTPGDISIKIVTDNSGSPSKTVLASGTLTATLVTGSYGWADATFTTSPSLTAGQKYWIIAIASVSASNYFQWGMGNAAGSGKYSANWNAGSPVWTAIGSDLNFKTWMGGVITSLSGITVNGDGWAHALSDCAVGGDAYYQTISVCPVVGVSYPGSNDASPGVMPISPSQIEEWEDIAEAGGVIAGAYSIPNGETETMGPQKIDGNLSVTGTLILSGPVWVRGNITFNNNSTLKVAASTGSSGAVLLADGPGETATKGTVYLSNNMNVMGNGNVGSYPMILSTNTTASAISLNNNADSVILYASEGTIDVANNATANQITAYSLHLNENATVNYVSGLQSQSFSNGPGGSWAVIPGTYVIVP